MASGLLTRNDLPTDAFTKPTWWVSAIYVNEPKRGWIARGYTPLRWQTFHEHVDSVQIDPTRSTAVSWVWYRGQWVRAA